MYVFPGYNHYIYIYIYKINYKHLFNLHIQICIPYYYIDIPIVNGKVEFGDKGDKAKSENRFILHWGLS